MNDNVVALFVDKNGPYPNLVKEYYTEENNALMYTGNKPVVAHPPCNLWTNLAYLNYKRYGGEHNIPGNDKGMFKFALDTVRKYGGVLEHPKYSRAWFKYGLRIPQGIGWQRDYEKNEWVCEVWQSAYGHKNAKRTWLLYCGNNPPLDCKWDRIKGTHQIGQFDKNKPVISKAAASRTPIEFAKFLIELAEHSYR